MPSPTMRDDWLRLAELLDAWAESAVPVDDREIAVTLTGGRTVWIVMTPDELGEMYVAFGQLPYTYEVIVENLESLPADRDFLVYSQYELVPRSARTLPATPPLPHFDGGRWHANPPDGRS